jgi:hypothetical protein
MFFLGAQVQGESQRPHRETKVAELVRSFLVKSQPQLYLKVPTLEKRQEREATQGIQSGSGL